MNAAAAWLVAAARVAAERVRTSPRVKRAARAALAALARRSREARAVVRLVFMPRV